MFEVISGMLGGIVSALGMGGGTILIVILATFLGLEQHKAQGTNIVFFIPTAITATIINIKNKHINWKFVRIILPFGIIGAVIGACVSINLNTLILKKIFGFFLLLVAIYEVIIYIKK